MSINRRHRSSNTPKIQARIARLRDKSLRQQKRSHDRELAFQQRRLARISWWQRTFKTPIVAYNRLFAQATSLWMAMLSLLGLSNSRTATQLLARSTDVPTTNRNRAKFNQTFFRSLFHEPLEARQLLAVTDVAALLGVHGWKSDDTRDSTGTDLVGSLLTNAGDPIVTPSTANDQAILQQVRIVDAPTGSAYPGALLVDGTSNNSGKSTASMIDTGSGFAPASDLLLPAFGATYSWYGQPNPTTRTVAFRIGVQSAQWATSQASFTATRSGESAWDLVLVHVPATSDNAWSTVSVDKDSGSWFLYGQAGNPNWAGIAGSSPPGGSLSKTLDD